ncbi:hypothetical protein ELH51_05825 [Rhizobium ruizarguesonis]|nr:hypothetical protein ELH51_05825 [Rhizobium ruizarguesonis]
MSGFVEDACTGASDAVAGDQFDYPGSTKSPRGFTIWRRLADTDGSLFHQSRGTVNHYAYFEQAPPRSWDQFEELCADVFQDEWQDAALVRHGRAGQSQHGVDIVGRAGALWPVGIQCKKRSVWPVSEVTVSELEAEVEKAKAFNPPLKAYFIVSTAPDDTVLQERARTITESHRSLGLFTVSVIGWGELVRRATRHTHVAAKHFGFYSTGPATPLLATWSASGSELLLDDRELGIAIRELMHDFIDFPAGRVIVRQKETEDLLFSIKERQASDSQSLDGREAILALRDKLEAARSREAKAVAGLQILLGHHIMRDYLRIIGTDSATLVVRSFVEKELDPHFTNISDLVKMRIYPPNAPPDQAVAVFMPGAELASIGSHRRKLRTEYPKLATDNIYELPKHVKFRYAIPAVIREMSARLKEGNTLDQLDKWEWFEMSAWRITY